MFVRFASKTVWQVALCLLLLHIPSVHSLKLALTQTPHADAINTFLLQTELKLNRKRRKHMHKTFSQETQEILCYLKEHVKVDLDPNNLKGFAPFPKCAVVSNSGVMLAHQYGKEIDSHDAVFRFNNAPIGPEYQDYVGKSETVRVFDHSGFDRITESGQLNNETLYVYVANADGPPDTADKARAQSDNVFELIGGPDVMTSASAALSEIYSGRWFTMGEIQGKSMEPTSGFLGMLVALTTCDTIDAYEMTPSTIASSYPFHYYSSLENGMNADQNSWHKTFQAEKDLWMRLSKTPDATVLSSGKSSLPGFSQVSCHGHTKAPKISLADRKSVV